MRKLFLLLSLFTVMILSCGTEGKQGGETSSNKEGKRKFKIGITQIVAHTALDKAREGFKDALKEAGIEAE